MLKKNLVVEKATVLYPFIDWIPDDTDDMNFGSLYLIMSDILRIKLDANVPEKDIYQANDIFDRLAGRK